MLLQSKHPLCSGFGINGLYHLKMNLNNLLCSFLEEALVNQVGSGNPICVSFEQ
jgi:hypothetical protein